MVITQDFESWDPSSILGGTSKEILGLNLVFLIYFKCVILYKRIVLSHNNIFLIYTFL